MRVQDEWRNLSTSERSPYVLEAAQEKARYEQEMSEYPKKANDAFFFFAEATRAEISAADPTIRTLQHAVCPLHDQAPHRLRRLTLSLRR